MIICCPSCQQRIEVEDDGRGERVECPVCNGMILLPPAATRSAAESGSSHPVLLKPSEPQVSMSPPFTTAAHRNLAVDQAASKCNVCDVIKMPGEGVCSECGEPTESTTVATRTLAERIAFFYFLLVASYSYILATVLTGQRAFEGQMLIYPPFALFITLIVIYFVLGYKFGRLSTMFETGKVPEWAKMPFSWLRFLMEFIYLCLFWAMFGGVFYTLMKIG